MKISVSIKVSDDFSKTELARGWVDIEDIFKFPVRVLKYIDNSDNKEKMFVSFPQKKNGEQYEEIVHPINKEMRNLVSEAVLDEMKRSINKGINVDISDVKVSLLKEEKKTGSITLKAMASVTMYGFVVNGIQIKEGNSGLFVQMPQHIANGEYKDTVYGTNASVQAEIRRKVLDEYLSKVEKEKLKVIPENQIQIKKEAASPKL